MEILYNESLKTYTTVRIGGIAERLYIPESSEELISLLETLPDYYILSGGSNVLINDQKSFKNVILLKKFDLTIENIGNGEYYVGASVRLQNLINTIHKDGYGGIEYLYSVPGLVGGAITMNAGRGRPYGLNISDYVTHVHVYENGTTKIIPKHECQFIYRSSIFKNNNIIILGARFTFDNIESKKLLEAKQERIQMTKNAQDYSGFNFGSVFMDNDWRIMWLVRRLHPGYKGGICYSKKTANWMLNNGDGTFKQARKLINNVEKLHRLIGKKAVPEVIIWD
ncbi:FAD-binding protein [Paenibacillus silvisoli]|uniref:FAD-binding protein n=1 Tax=Paenibacillus silvisoli TaxID=3110539 RepID=UPI002805A79D|nr:FAD-binding protein [Paenibacillus silvisoli]